MAYNVISQGEPSVLSNFNRSDDSHSQDLKSPSSSANLEHVNDGMHMVDQSHSDRLTSMIKSMLSQKSSYEIIRDEDLEPIEIAGRSKGPDLSEFSYTKNHSTSSSGHDESISMPTPLSYEAMRTVSREGSLRHPTPDLQSLQGAYVGNVERLERTAERLSLSSDIGEELRRIRMEQKRSESRRSSIPTSPIEDGGNMPSVPRKFSLSSTTSTSILRMNSIARSGGFSPNGYVTSPVGSLRSPSWSHHSIRGQPTTRVSRLTQPSEPLQEGKLLDSRVSSRAVSADDPPKPWSANLQIINPDEFTVTGDHENGQIAAQSMDDNALHIGIDTREQTPERPTTAASTDTYQQATGLFADFDGVHVTPYVQDTTINDSNTSRQVSGQSSIAPKPQPNTLPPPEDGMVYYPAPVPMMLNLPQRLSKLPAAAQREKRRSQALGALSNEARKSAAWLPGVLEVNDEEGDVGNRKDAWKKDQDNRRSMAAFPPQLRASMFFEHRAVQQEVEVKENSAVATLDSILDASAHAPVTAFTDHPIVGHIGGDVYSKSAARNSTGNMLALNTEKWKSRKSMDLLKNRQSSNSVFGSAYLSNGTITGLEKPMPQFENLHNLDEAEAAALSGEGTPLQGLQDGERVDVGQDEGDEYQQFHDAQEELEDEQDGDALSIDDDYNGVPTTLLAELQMRKKQQKQRNRTAATAFPNGMHSTLLELDAVAQIQRQTRKQKQTTLAWEDPTIQQPGVENADDEDVPLGVLFPGRKATSNRKGGHFDDDVPLGLIARRDMEDNEPLSHRRARLRGEPTVPRRRSSNKLANMQDLGLLNAADVSGVATGDDEGETLGQRLRRLRDPLPPSGTRSISGAITSEVLSHFGRLQEAVSSAIPPAQTPDHEEETLGQRRKRLQAEREAKSRDVSGGSADITRPPVTKRHSMADILQTHPAAGARSASYEMPPGNTASGNYRTNNGLLHQHEQLKRQQQQQQLANYMPADGINSPALHQNWQRPMSMGPQLPYGQFPMASGIGMTGYSPYGVNGFNANHEYGGVAPNGNTSMLPMGQGPVASNLKQRDMVDRWRQSIMY